MGDTVKSLAKIKVGNIHCFPLVDPPCHVIIGGYQIGQTWFTVGESMLTTFDDHLLFYMLGEDLQNDLFNHLSRDGGEAHQPVVSQVLLLALFEDGSNTGQLSQLPVFKVYTNTLEYTNSNTRNLNVWRAKPTHPKRYSNLLKVFF